MKTEILVVTDRSGSMGGLVNDVIGGFNKFIEEQRAVPGEARVTYTQFDNQYEVVYAGKPLQDVPQLDKFTYVPRGTTALLDAIGRTLNEQGKRIAAEQWAELVVVCIITDGEENSSREFTGEQIKEMTAHAEKNGWKFIYLGANQDAFAVSRSLGMMNAVAANYVPTSAGTHQAYTVTSSAVRSLRTGGK